MSLSVIHEIGDFGYPKNLTPEQQALYEQQQVAEDAALEERIKQREREATSN